MRLSTSAAVVAAVAWMLVAPGTGAGAYVIHDRTWLISTAAGGVGGPGSGRQIPVEPCAVAPAAGGLYIADQILTTAAGTSAPAGPVIREVSQRTGALTTPLGDGGPGASADGTNGSQADLAVGCGLVLDHSGNLLFSQTTFQGTAPTVQLPVERIRVLAARSGRFYGKAMRAGRIYTIAGNGKIGFGGDGGPALKAALSTPGGLAVDAAGSVYIEDTGNLRLRIIARKTGRFFGQAMKAGDIYTIAGDGQFGFSGDGVLATRTAMGLLDPSVAAEPTGQAVAIDRFGNAVVADVANNRIRVIAATSGRFYGQAMKAGFIYTVAGDGQDGATGDGGPATAAAMSRPRGLAIDRSGNILIAQDRRCLARVVAAKSGQFYGRNMTAGDIYSIGNSTACFSIGAAIDRAGNLISVGPWVAAIAAKSGKFYGRAMTAGHQYLITSTMSASHVGDRAMAARAEIWPQGIALDSRGDLLMVDFEPGDRQQGQIRLVPAGSLRVFGRLVRRGHIYTIAAGLGDGAFARPLQGIAVDRFGNAIVGLNTSIDVLAVRAGRFYGQTMRAGHLYPVAGGGTGGGSGVAAKSVVLRPAGLTTDRDGNIVIADTFGANLVRVVAVRSGTFYGTPMKAGDIYSIAGTGSASGLERDGVPGTESVIDPVGVVTDKAGNIVVTDVNNNTVRVIAARPGKFYGQQMIPGDIYRLAGNGHQGFRGNGSPARAAEFSAPCGLALDADGNVLVADLGNRRIRVVAVRSGTFYGLAMKAGDIYTIAGSGGLPGTPMQPPSAHGTGKFADGIVARNAELLSPAAVTVAASGAVFVADSYRVRVITP